MKKPTQIFAILMVALYAASLTAHAQKANADDRAPFGWLQTGTKEVVLDIRQEGLEPGSKQDAAVFIGWILRDLTKADFKVYLTRSFIESEIEYWRHDSDFGVQKQIDKAMSQCLQDSLNADAIDWACLANIAREQGDQFTGQRRWPWSIGSGKDFDTSHVLLQSKQPQNIPTLVVKLKWTSRDGFQAKIPLPGKGLTVWNLSASLKLMDASQKTVFQKEYAAPAFKSSYEGWGDTPSSHQTQRILYDIGRGVNVERVTPLKPARKDAPLLTGTTWEMKESGSEYDCTFDRSGIYKYWRYGKLNEGDKWEQDGDVVRFSVNSKYAEYEGRMEGDDKITGTARSDRSAWSWTAIRVRK